MVEVVDWKDNDDGSAKVTFEITKEEENFFCELGILLCITEGMKISKEGETLDE